MRWYWIDRFVEFERGKRAVAIKAVAMSEEQNDSYLPGYPVMPSSLIIEGMAQTAGILVGEISGFLLAWRAADELHLTDLGVTARARRRGVARALVGHLCAEGRRRGSRVILLEVRESNHAARALYGGLGFLELDRRMRYSSDTG